MNSELYNSPKFDRTLYNKHDTPAKNKAKNFFKQLGYGVVPEVLEYYSKYDFELTNNQSVEVEVKVCWYTQHFPFNTMDVAGRKINSKADWFVQFNCDYTALAICPMKSVHKSEQYRKDTKYSTDEVFFAVNKSEIDFYHLNKSTNKWMFAEYNEFEPHLTHAPSGIVI